MERYEMKRIIQFIRGMYPGWKADSSTVDSWFEFFRDRTEKEVKDAVIAFARKKTFIPNAAEILTELMSVPRFELLNFSGRMYTIKVYTRNSQQEDSLFCFSFATKDAANEELARLKACSTYDEIVAEWAAWQNRKSPPDSHFRELYEKEYGGQEWAAQ